MGLFVICFGSLYEVLHDGNRKIKFIPVKYLKKTSQYWSRIIYIITPMNNSYFNKTRFNENTIFYQMSQSNNVK